MRYFGTWTDDPLGEKALKKYLRTKDYLQAGIAIPEETALTLEELCRCFLDAKEQRLEGGKLSPRTLKEWHTACN